MIIQELLNKTIQFFKDKNIESARLDAEILVSEALGLKRIELYTNFEKPLDETQITKCRDSVRRRSQGEPVAYIIGKKVFYRHDFIVNSNVLIPRPETETLVEQVLNFFPDKDKAYSILDLGTGSGILACTFSKEYPNSKVTAVDVSEDALEVASINAENLEISEDQLQFICADATTLDLSTLSTQSFDIIVSNPPYISADDPNIQAEVKKFEPSQALFASENGLFFINAWARKYAPLLKSPGIMIFEMGNTQANETSKLFLSTNLFSDVKVVKDLSGHDRFIKGTKNG
ncbi:MAG: peptide chain release factor N(5)-glutamine methyltransferase [Bdellovibrionota bacterium]